MHKYWIPLSAIVAKGVLNSPTPHEDNWTCREVLPRWAEKSRKSLVPLPREGIRPPAPCDKCLREQQDIDALDALRPHAVDLYAGGGGLLYGIDQHFDVRHAVEADFSACTTLRANFAELKVHYCTVEEYANGSSQPQPGSVGLLVAGPPW